MAYRSFSLIPTLNSSLLTDRFSQMDNFFSRLTGEKPLTNIPAYNLLQKNEQYELSISVPGYEQNELDVSILNKQLTVCSKLNEKSIESKEEEEIQWIHQGIKKSDFTLNFTLEHRIIINRANLINGILIIHFAYDIPEQEKPKQITIDIKNSPRKVISHQSN